MGQGKSKYPELYIHALKAMLKIRGGSQVAATQAVFRFCTGYLPVVS
jgi:hypothetical protein